MGAKLKRGGVSAGLTGLSTLAAVLLQNDGRAFGQEVELPQINVSDTRLVGTGTRGRAAGAAPAVPGTSTEPAPAPVDVGAIYLPRGGGGIVGASTSVIPREDIERSPALTLPDLVSREAGTQSFSLFGGVNGAGTTVDLRGFGITGQQNTLILLNGRRLNDWDLQGFDWSTVPVNSIERVEITRGNSAGVLYGDGAVGGVINIVTRSSAGIPPSARIEGVFGSFRYKQGNASVNTSSGPFSASAYTSLTNTDSYRVNNELQQRNTVGELRYTVPDFSAFVRLSGEYQRLGYPGGRIVSNAINQYVTDRNGSNFPYDYADRDSYNLTAGFVKTLAPGFDLIVDGGVRRKNVQSGFFSGVGAPFAYNQTELTTSSFTPRIDFKNTVFGMPVKILAGLDYYDTKYDTDRALAQDTINDPIHLYNLSDRMLAGYVQQTVTVLPSTDISAGYRLQRNTVSARDSFNAAAPGGSLCFFGFCFPTGIEALPFDGSQNNRAAHLGFEHRFNDNLAAFGRLGRSFRVPTVDERIGMSPFGSASNFQLRTQTSKDKEIGARLRFGGLTIQSSYYDMQLENELHLNPITFANENFDPTRRRGFENTAIWQVTDALRLRGTVTRVNATYEEGQFQGRTVPLVAKWTESAGLTWNIIGKQLTLDASARFVSKRWQDADEANQEAVIPSYAVVDLRLGGEIDNFHWSVAVQNLLNENYYDYSVVFGPQLYNVYPAVGRTVMVRAGMKW